MRRRAASGSLLLSSLLLLASAGCKTGTDGSASLAKADDGGAAAVGFQAPTSWPPELGEKEFVDAEGNNEDFWVDKLVEQSDKTVAGLKESTGSARRSAHSKAHGCVTGTFEVLADRDERSKHGIFANEGKYPVWIRFSNATPNVQSDVTPDGRGMAVKVIGDFGPKMLPGQEQSNGVDFPFVSGPIFPVPDVKEYLALQQDLPGYLASHLQTAALAIKVLGRTMKSPLLGTYWSMGAFKLGPQAVKFSTRPCVGPWFNIPLSLGENYLRNAMIKQLETKKQEACFDFGVQFQANAESMPVEDPTVEWRESASLLAPIKRLFKAPDPVSPFVTIAKIRIPAQAFASAAQDQFCERMSFNPWRTVEDQRPLGNLMRARLKVYSASLKKRFEINGQHALPDVLTGTQADVTAN